MYKATLKLINGLLNEGHKILDVRTLENSNLEKRYEQQRAAMKVKTQRFMYHTTKTAGDSIEKHGFRPAKTIGAFGKGIYLGGNMEQVTLYATRGVNTTFVCRALVGRAHANEPVEMTNSDVTKPLFVKPKEGYDSLYFGKTKKIAVIPHHMRVLPIVRVDWQHK
jgi:hypothetical protein